MSRLDDIDLSSASGKEDVLARTDVFQTEEPLPRARVPGQTRAPETSAFVDLPLSAEGAAPRSPAKAPARPAVLAEAPAARLAPRIGAFAADGALVVLLVAAALLAATSGRGEALGLAALLWTGVFALYLSFFSTVVPLILFGKTVGMTLTGLTARGPGGSAPLTASQSARRWLGTAVSLLALGLPLLATRRQPGAPSLADRLSGRPLAWESREH